MPNDDRRQAPEYAARVGRSSKAADGGLGIRDGRRAAAAQLRAEAPRLELAIERGVEIPIFAKLPRSDPAFITARTVNKRVVKSKHGYGAKLP